MGELSGALKTFMDDLDAVSERLDKNTLIQNAKLSVKDELGNAKISKEEKAKLFSAYVQQISISVLAQAVEIVRDVPTAMANEEKAQYDKASAEASLRKQLGYSLDTEGKLVDEKDGMLDKQIGGFGLDMFYKIASIIGQENQMLVQNDQAVKPWQVDAWKLAVEAMAQGKINFKEVNDVTVAEWKADATDPNGMNQ